jgi:hypothetical protein
MSWQTSDSPRVLVLGSATCLSSQWVVQELTRRRAPFAYVDYQDFEATGVEPYFYADAGGDRVVFSYPSRELAISTAGLRSLYFRETGPKHSLWQLEPLRLRHLQAPEVERHHWEQVLRFASSVLEYLAHRCFCLAPLAVAGNASHKLLQLMLAGELGFRVPATYIGSSLDEMRDFVAGQERVVCKPFYPQNVFWEGYNYRTYTALVTADDLAGCIATRYPIILQEAFVDKTDVRVGIVGNRLFATEIRLPSVPERDYIVDFRHYVMLHHHAGQGGFDYRAHDLPPAVRERCVAFARACGLQYAMMDLLLTPEGEYVFLESNTKGMHGEVESGGHDVMGAIVDLLLDPETHRLR